MTYPDSTLAFCRWPETDVCALSVMAVATDRNLQHTITLLSNTFRFNPILPTLTTATAVFPHFCSVFIIIIITDYLWCPIS